LIKALVVIIVVIVVLKLAVSRLEPAMVFFPIRGEDETPARFGLRYHAVKLRASDGVQIAAWQLEPENPTADVVYFHGNGGNLSMWLPVFATLHGFGYRVLAVDYRGYGLSEGTATESGLLLDAEAVARHAASSRVGNRPLIYWGRSLGGPIAAAAAGVANPDALVLESTFPDKASVVRSMPLLLLLNVFSSYRLDTAGRLRGFSKPVLVVHGDGDTIIPYALGQRLFERLDAPKRFVTVPGGDHNDFFDARHEAYWTPIRAFIDAL
jgi:pimeloyl-ACP methyl ester carboxylesterase